MAPSEGDIYEPESLAAWEPRGGQALLTCKILRGTAYARGGSSDPQAFTRTDAWEPCTYEFTRTSYGTWTIDTDSGFLQRDTWVDVVEWLCSMQPEEISLVTSR